MGQASLCCQWHNHMGSRDYNFQTYLPWRQKEKKNKCSVHGGKKKTKKKKKFDFTIEEISVEFGLLGICLKNLAMKVQF